MAKYTVAHIEIPTENAREAATFYSNVFGWKTETNVEHNYVIFKSEGGLRGGFVEPSEPTYKSERALVYLATDDIDASLAEIEANGGKTVIGKTEIPHVGVWAIFADPAGNEFGLYTRTQQG